jgi:hypothetical protein
MSALRKAMRPPLAARPNANSSGNGHRSVTPMWSVPVSMMDEKCRITAAAKRCFSSDFGLKLSSNCRCGMGHLVSLEGAQR